MELLEGETLAHRLEKGPLPAAEVLALGTQIADALDRAHRAGVVHRDLKPDNLLLTDHRGQRDFVKVLDFGVAKMIDPGTPSGVELTARGELFGTPEYMAPEQIRGGTITPQTDIYSLGVVTYELATGAPPFSGTLMELFLAHTRTPPIPPSARRPEAGLSPAFDAIVAKCLAKDPADRYGTARELREAVRGLGRIVAGRSPSRAQFEDTDASSPLRLWSQLREPLGAGTDDDVETREFTAHKAAAPPPNEVRQRIVRDLAERLRDHRLGSPEITMALTRLLQAEERVYAEQAEIALVESHVAETHQTIDERAARLRYAAIQLSQERARLADRSALGTAMTLSEEAGQRSGAPTPVGGPEVEGHLAELEGRVAALENERQQRIAALEARAETHRKALTTWVAEVEKESELLENLVADARPQVRALELLQLYVRLSELDEPTLDTH